MRRRVRNGGAFRRLAAFAILSFSALLLNASPAAAQVCQAQFTDIAFGNIDLTTRFAADAVGTVTYSCQGLANRTARVCPNLGSGSGGDTGSGSPRLLLSGANQLRFSFYQDAARSVVWGSWVWPWVAQYPAPQIDIALGPTGQATLSAPVYGRILSGQQTAFAGTYTSTFSSGHILISSGYSTAGNCATISTTGGLHPSFNVTATILRSCSLTTTPLSFGGLAGLSAVADASGQLRVTCTNGAAYSIGLDGGTTNASNPTQRKMTKGADTITYGLYGNAARTQPWFNTGGYYQAGGTGSGAAQSYTVYGRIPVQTTPPPGLYTDTVVAIVTY